jgi:hypothetical protein
MTQGHHLGRRVGECGDGIDDIFVDLAPRPRGLEFLEAGKGGLVEVPAITFCSDAYLR